MGDAPGQTSTTNHVSEDTHDDDADLKQADFGHDRLGVGSPVPKDIADGTFIRRAPTSNDKLLEQLIGKKRAKAHLAAKQEAERASARQQPAWQQQQNPAVQAAEESDDEEESRAAVIASRGKRNEKAQLKSKSKSIKGKREGSTEVAEPEEKTEGDVPAATEVGQKEEKEDSDDDIDLKPKKRVKKSRAKPTSYLDELLAERSAKKKGKAKSTEED
ncbi:hypothetical protein SLS61_000924 [Didymella pomorum]